MFIKRESFGFVPQLIGFIQHAYYASIEFNENTTNFKMITGSEQNVHRFLFDLPKLVFEILFLLFIANVKAVIQSYLPRC